MRNALSIDQDEVGDMAQFLTRLQDNGAFTKREQAWNIWKCYFGLYRFDFDQLE